MTANNPDELVFTVTGSTASPIDRVGIATLGLTEVQHLQEWVLAHPECRLPVLRDQAVARSMGPRRVRIDRLTR